MAGRGDLRFVHGRPKCPLSTVCMVRTAWPQPPANSIGQSWSFPNHLQLPSLSPTLLLPGFSGGRLLMADEAMARISNRPLLAAIRGPNNGSFPSWFPSIGLSVCNRRTSHASRRSHMQNEAGWQLAFSCERRVDDRRRGQGSAPCSTSRIPPAAPEWGSCQARHRWISTAAVSPMSPKSIQSRGATSPTQICPLSQIQAAGGEVGVVDNCHPPTPTQVFDCL